MATVIVHDERTLAELAGRILGRRGNARLTDAQVEAIRRANPDVDLDDLRPGTVLTIPDEVRGRSDARPDEILDQGVGALVSALAQVAKRSGEEAHQRAKEDASDRTVVRRTLELRAVQDAAARDRELGAEVERIRERLDTADRDAEEAGAERERAVATWTEDLERLQDLGR